MSAKTGFASQKVPSGKLLQAEVTCDNSVIISVRLTGDFFLHPEDGITALEQCFVGVPLNANLGSLIDRVKHVVADHQLTLVGMTSEYIAATVLQAMITCTLCTGDSST